MQIRFPARGMEGFAVAQGPSIDTWFGNPALPKSFREEEDEM